MKLTKISIGYMSYFDMLPIEIVEYIFKIRDNIMVNLIIKNWYIYIGKKIVATEFLIKMRDITNINNYYTINNNINSNYFFNDINIRRLKYINSIINGRENKWWKDIIQKIGMNCIYINLNNNKSLNLNMQIALLDLHPNLLLN